MPAVDAKHEAPLRQGLSMQMELIQNDRWIPFPVKIVSSVQLK